jgi:plastocyanin
MLFVLMVVVAITGAACSSGDDGGNGGSGAGSDGGGSAAEGGCTADNAVDLTGDDPFTVTIQDFAFTPDCFSAKSASSITVENKDGVTHTFTIDGTQVDVSIDGGQTFNGEPAGLAPGTYPFRCTIHSTMTGTVIVS